jgi:hypothetical protein
MNCAGISSADVGDYEMEKSNGEGRRKAPSLSPPTAGTVQAARKAANNIISSVIGQAAANIKADESNMDISNIPPPDTAGGPNAVVSSRRLATRRRRRQAPTTRIFANLPENSSR